MLIDPDFGGLPPCSRAEMGRDLRQIIERALALLDQLQADPDLEEGGDTEMSLGWEHGRPSTYIPDLFEDAEATALERHGKGFLPSGGDDAEDTHDAETVNEDGGDINDEPHDEEMDVGVDDEHHERDVAIWRAEAGRREETRKVVQAIERRAHAMRGTPHKERCPVLVHGVNWGGAALNAILSSADVTRARYQAAVAHQREVNERRAMVRAGKLKARPREAEPHPMMKLPEYPGDAGDLVIGYRPIAKAAGVAHSAVWRYLNERGLVPVYRARNRRGGSVWAMAITKADAERLSGLARLNDRRGRLQ